MDRTTEILLVNARMWWMRRALNIMWAEITIMGKFSIFLDKFLAMGHEYLKLHDEYCEI